MPDRSEKLLRKKEEADKYELPYISKSRIKQWIENPEHFRLKYLEGIVEPETDAMVRGTRIHESIEYFYERLLEEGADGEPTTDEMVARLPPDRKKWTPFIEPYISNFLRWEASRWHEASSTDAYMPVSVEEEKWRDGTRWFDNSPEWMGIADAVYHADSIAEINRDEGVVIVDFKTGDVPDKRYRSKGIYTELQYYVMVFEQDYNIAGAAAYYPRHDELLVKPHGGPYRERVLRNAGEILEAVDGYDGSTSFEADPGPLCKWGPGDDEQSAYYGVCSQCTWGVPINNQNTFEAMIDEGYDDEKIADELGTSTDAVNYWKYKLDL